MHLFNMPQKRKPLYALNGKSKIVKTDIGSFDRQSCNDDGMSTVTERAMKGSNIKYTEIVKENSKPVLERKDLEYAKLGQENKNLEAKKYKAMNKNLESKIINLNKMLKEQEEEYKASEMLVKTLQVRVENQDAVVQNLLEEIRSLERNENLLKKSLETVEVDVKIANTIVMEKDDCITNMKNDLLNTIKESSKLKESS